MRTDSGYREYHRCSERDLDTVYFVINEAAQAYHGLIPPECDGDPYMSRPEFRDEIRAGVEFWGIKENGTLRGVMGIQRVSDVVLIRHAYTLSEFQSCGIGGGLLKFLLKKTSRPVLIGTWANVGRTIQFYEKHGFHLVSTAAKEQLLRKYWQVPDTQINNSVVLANVLEDALIE